MEIIGFILAVLIGVTLGLMGSGGSILTVPVLVYILKIDPNLATTSSLFAIAVSSLIGSFRNHLKKNINYKTILEFGIPSVLMVFLTRQFILPLVPDFIQIGKWSFHQNLVLMVLFSCIMIFSAIRMIKTNYVESDTTIRVPKFITILQGAFVGLITGVVGAGGGFLIIPALIGFYKIPINKAIATSLAIICINSIFGLAGDLEKLPLINWTILSRYTILLVLGMFIGFYISKYFKGNQLKRGLGILILLIGLFILFKELLIT